MVLALVGLAGQAVAAPPAAQVDREASALSERLVSPCCWRETLSSHASPLADQLRAEIRERLGAGEDAAAIESDLVARYGPRVRALPRDWDPRPVMGGIALAVAAGILVLFVRWTARRRRKAAAATAAPATADARLEDVLDDELAALDA